MTGTPRFQSDTILKQERDPALTGARLESDRTSPGSTQRYVATGSDPLSVASLYRTALQDTEFYVGKVLFALPWAHHYKVQLSGAPTVDAILMENGSSVALGARVSSMLPPGSHVCVYKPPGFTVHVILGTLPALCTNDKYNVAQILQLGSNSQVRSQAGYQALTNLLEDNGNINNFGCGRPLDSVSFEHAVTTETGISLLIDSFQAALSVSEGCGVFLNWWDNYTKLTGFQLDIESYVDHIRQRYDEGENVYIRGNITYPWEATGAYAKDTGFTTENSPQDYQTDKKKPYGKIDIPPGEEDLAPIYRYMEYGGYLGQGYTRMLMKPAKDGGKRKYSDEEPDYGLWQESVALDGSYTLRSAKSVYIGKYALIPIPKRKKLVEDQKDGDDARKSNYKFSGEFGGNKPHKVKDIKFDGQEHHLLRASGVLDLLTYNYNWKSTHPFYYHEKDYKYKDERELDKITKAQSKLDYSSTPDLGYLKEPEKKKLKIDDRYNEVEYFQSMSFLTFLEDGGVVLGDGYGAQLTMTGGKMQLEAPNDIMIMPGGRHVTLCDEMYVRARNNIEFSSSDKDVRFKAENNMQFLSANSGRGGMLFESKSTSSTHIFNNLYGDQVKDNGITFLCKKSDIGVLGKNVYVRSGADKAHKGSITLDAAQGEKDLVCYSKTMNIFNSKGVNIWHSPEGEEGGAFDASHRFGKGVSLISGHCVVQKHICNPEGGLISRKTLVTAGNVIAIKKMAQKDGGMLGDSTEAAGDVNDALQKCQEAIIKHRNFGEPIWNAKLKLKYYLPNIGIGNETVIKQFGFSFNDRPEGKGKPFDLDDTWSIIESRWQQYVRLDLATGGSAWTEKPVKYQESDLYPFPGKKHWKTEKKLQQLKELKLFDATEAYAKDRKDPVYEEPKLSKFEPVKADGNYKLIP